MSKYLIIGSLLIVLGMCAACGAQGSVAEAGSCKQIVLEVDGRIVPESSGLTCAGVRQLLDSIPARPGSFLIVSKKPRVTWKCYLYPSAGDSKDLVTCSSRGRKFSVRRVR